jgi:alkanesulfonate monooxygenase SsuD/methylene tetrahydromethanopterin reductase-like flavin-dependent oxidoreductase (luciferase family)
MWIGGKSDAAFRRAARLGDGWISDTISTLQGEKAHIDTYRRYCQEAGRPAGEVVVLRNAWVAQTRKEAGEVFIPAMRDWFAYYDRMGTSRPDDSPTNRVAAGEQVPVEDYRVDRAFCGTPDDVINEIKNFRDTLGVDCFGIVATGPQDTPTLRRMLTLFGKEVIPAFR